MKKLCLTFTLVCLFSANYFASTNNPVMDFIQKQLRTNETKPTWHATICLGIPYVQVCFELSCSTSAITHRPFCYVTRTAGSGSGNNSGNGTGTGNGNGQGLGSSRGQTVSELVRSIEIEKGLAEGSMTTIEFVSDSDNFMGDNGKLYKIAAGSYEIVTIGEENGNGNGNGRVKAIKLFYTEVN